MNVTNSLALTVFKKCVKEIQLWQNGVLCFLFNFFAAWLQGKKREEKVGLTESVSIKMRLKAKTKYGCGGNILMYHMTWTICVCSTTWDKFVWHTPKISTTF